MDGMKRGVLWRMPDGTLGARLREKDVKPGDPAAVIDDDGVEVRTRVKRVAGMCGRDPLVEVEADLIGEGAGEVIRGTPWRTEDGRWLVQTEDERVRVGSQIEVHNRGGHRYLREVSQIVYKRGSLTICAVRSDRPRVEMPWG